MGFLLFKKNNYSVFKFLKQNECALISTTFIIYTSLTPAIFLNCETGSASTGTTGIRIIKSKTP
jgi:hypothetical protein